MKARHISQAFKIIGGLFTIFCIVYKLISTKNLDVNFVIASGLAGVLIANIFISVDISIWIERLKGIKDVIKNWRNIKKNNW